MLCVNYDNMSNATNHLVKFGNAYFKSTNQTKTDRIIGRLFSIVLSLLLHTIATYHATCTGILKLSGASSEEIERRRQACNVAFRECLNLFLFGNFCQIPDKKVQAPVLPAPSSKEDPVVLGEVIEKLPANLVKAPANCEELDVSDAETDISTPPRSRSVPPEMMSPRAQKGISIILTPPTGTAKASVSDNGTSRSLSPISSMGSSVVDLGEDKAISEASAKTHDSSQTWVHVGSGGAILIKKSQRIIRDKVTGEIQVVDKKDSDSDCGSDGWEKV